ncbi:NAD(P)-binding protein [Durotheca rogersii]|uniref:NAD(P)-binding protein n=1 Tax=Durotheca rogersii TaxID=419775 RepID=UPI00221FBE6F|nr:NAD(P)-binding protein [Durotheca rogersii]KAI5863846.1 NAD(P)-binding protein [Durotheca rogersii]
MASPHPLSAATMFSLKDWVAVVTGGGTGIGLMIAQTLAANGAKVYITGRRADVLERSARIHGTPEKLGPLGGSIVPIAMDVTSKDSIKSVVAEIGQKEQYVNLLVNNAGIYGSRPNARPENGPEAFGEAMFAEGDSNIWQKVFDTNCTSCYLTTAAFLPLLAKAASGPTGKVGSVIINSSVSASLRIIANSLTIKYAQVSKAAVSHLTRQLAYEFSHEKISIRVNGLGLGYFPSEMTTGTSNEQNESIDLAPRFAELMSGMDLQSVKRMGTPEEVATIVLTLAVNDYMWGTITIVDGGLSLRAAGDL